MSDVKPNCPMQQGVECSPGPHKNGRCCHEMPEYPISFTVNRRNPHHWDVYAGNGRAFRIRGEPGAILVLDERYDRELPIHKTEVQVKTVGEAITYIADIFMAERPRVYPVALPEVVA